MRTNLILEAIIIGIFTILLTNIMYFLFNNRFPDTEIFQMNVGAFFVGVIMHTGFEFIGANEAWCRAT
jgi:hypothetical protein